MAYNLTYLYLNIKRKEEEVVEEEAAESQAKKTKARVETKLERVRYTWNAREYQRWSKN